MLNPGHLEDLSWLEHRLEDVKKILDTKYVVLIHRGPEQPLSIGQAEDMIEIFRKVITELLLPRIKDLERRIEVLESKRRH